MKKIVILLLALSLLLVGCGKGEPTPSETTVPETTVPETTVPETTEETEPETTEPETTAETEPPLPQTRDYIVQADKTPAVLMLLSGGQSVEVVGDLDETYHIVKTEAGYGLVEKGLLRFGSDEAYEPWTGYAYNGSELMPNYQLTGEPLRTLTLNTQVQVLEELPHCYLVSLEDVTGFVAKDGLSRSYIRYGGGGGGGQDGGDISMGVIGGIRLLSYTAPQEGESTGTAEAVCDGVMVLLGWYDREDIAQVITEEGYAPAWEGWHTVYIEGFCAYVPQGLLWDPETEAFAQWDGYSAYNTLVYDNYLLLGDPVKTLGVNTVVTVLWDTGTGLVVSIDGEILCVAPESLSATRRSTGGGGGGGDWTPPAL